MEEDKVKVQMKSGLTRAIEELEDLNINPKKKDRNIDQKGGYLRADIDEFNNEIMEFAEAADILVKRAEGSSHISDDGFYKSESQSAHFNKATPEAHQRDIKTKSKKQVSAKSQSSLKMLYQAEVSQIKERIGSVKSVRKSLGLSQRKAAQLLLVDPSAWNRWEKSGNDAPFYIYRALEWFLLSEKKHPFMGSSFWLANSGFDSSEADLDKLKQDIKEETISALKAESNPVLEMSGSAQASQQYNLLDKKLLLPTVGFVFLVGICIGLLL